MVKAFGLMLVAVVIIVIAAPLVFVLQALRHLIMRKPLGKLFWNVAIGLDQLGGSIIYLEPDWTVSSRTCWLRAKGNVYAMYFERFIDFFFGLNHCAESCKNEFGKEDA